jgi:hypothetical protein
MKTPRYDLTTLMEPVARKLLGEPNEGLSSGHELRFGTRGSMAVDLKKGSWFDHEAGNGGGPLELVERETGRKGVERFEWIEQEGLRDKKSRSHGSTNGQRPNRAKLGPIVATFDYVDEDGTLLFQVTKHDPKDFRQRKPNGRGGWIDSIKGVRRVPYRLPELLEALAQDRVVLVPEGEKDVDR